jgi:hypothetical protein
MDLKQCVDCSHLAQDSAQWWAFVNKVMNIPGPLLFEAPSPQLC